MGRSFLAPALDPAEALGEGPTDSVGASAVPRHPRSFAYRFALLTLLATGGCYQRATPGDYNADLVRWKKDRAVAASVATSTGAAPKEAGGVRVLTLADAWALAQAHQNRDALDAADAAVLRADTQAVVQLRNPTLRLSNLHVDELIERDPDIELALRFPLPIPGQTSARRDAALARLEGRRASQATERFRRQHALERLFVDAWAAQSRLVASQIHMEAISRRAAAVRAQLVQGTATEVDASRRDLDLALARRTVDRHALLVEAVRGEVARMTGLPAAGQWRLKGVQPTDSAPSTVAPASVTKLEDAVTAAVGYRTSGAQLQWAVAEAKADVFVAKSEGWPWFDFVQVGYRFQSPLRNDTFAFALSLKLPLFNVNGAGVDVARAKLLVASMRRDAWVQTVTDEVRAARDALLRAHRHVETLKTGVVAAARVHRVAVAKAVKARTATPDALDQAAAGEAKAATMLLEGQIQVRYARWRLSGAIGRPLPTTTGPTNSHR